MTDLSNLSDRELLDLQQKIGSELIARAQVRRREEAAQYRLAFPTA